MAFEGLADRLQNAIKKIRGSQKVTEDDLKETLREVRMALLEADVNFKVVKDFVARIKERAMGQEVLASLTPGQFIIKIVNVITSKLLITTNIFFLFFIKIPTLYNNYTTYFFI